MIVPNEWENRILLVNKIPGLTSFETIKKIKNTLQVKKIGHTGTLDKFAEGLLILLTGKYTRLASLFLDLSKEYIADIELGKTTDTLDPEGTISGTGPIPDPEAVKAVLPDFTGEKEQVPPLYSAVHHNGQRAYKLVRSGKSPDLKARKIRISYLELIEYTPPHLKIRVRCSKGTYIRALARDIGMALDSCGYVTRLKRTCIGKYTLTDAVDLSNVNRLMIQKSCAELITDLEGTERLTINEDFQRKIITGNMVFDYCFLESSVMGRPIPDGKYMVFNTDNQILAAIKKYADKYSYLSVLEKSRSKIGNSSVG